MALKFQVDSLEGIDEALRPHYKERDGKFTLDVAGSVSKAVLETEQKERRKAEKSLADAQTSLERFADIDPEKVVAMRKQVATLLDEKGKLSLEQLSPEDRAAFREEEFGRINKEHENELGRKTKELEAERDSFKTQFEETQAIMIQSSRDALISKMFAETIRPEFLPDAQLRAKSELQWDETEKRFFDSDNNRAEVWAEKLMEKRKVWLPDNVSGGARGSSGTKVIGSERERAYEEAEKKGDYPAMAKYAPVSE